jgi:peptidoglycan/LPS O-acetylase OafA/YrhL
MRAIAVLCVVAVHAAVYGAAIDGSLGGRLLSHLNVGVTIFFLISGFLLYRPFVAERTGGGAPPAVADYGKRRFLRIYPAYWVALTLLTVLPGLTGVVSGGGLSQYALFWTLPVGDGRDCFDPGTGCGLAQTWSLVVEVSFYLVLPLYALATARLARGRPTAVWLGWELAVLALLGAASALVQGTSLSSVSWTGATVLSYWLWFALGMALALLSVAFGDAGRLPTAVSTLVRRPLLAWLGAAFLYAAACAFLPATPFLFGRSDRLAAYLLYAGIATLLLVPAVFGDGLGGGPRRLLAHPVVAWLGLISYGIFLWHFVVAFELGFKDGHDFAFVLAATLAISIAAAATSYYLVEKPLLRLKYRRLSDVLGGAR